MANTNLPFAMVYTALESTWTREVIGKAIANVTAATGRRLKLPDLIAAVKDECAHMERAASTIRQTARIVEEPDMESKKKARLMRKFAEIAFRWNGEPPAWVISGLEYAEGYQRQSCAQWGYDRRANQ